MPDTEGPEKKEHGKREFMREKIVKQSMSRRQIAKRIIIFLFLAVGFGAIAAVSFVLSKPLADKYLSKETAEESSSIMFTRDEPETVPPETMKETAPPEYAEKEISEAVSEAMSDYTFTVENLNALYGAVWEIGQQADKGIVTVRSGTRHMDLFGNPVENTGDYAGAVIAKTSGEYLIFTYADAVAQADSISVIFFDGTEAVGQVRQVDAVLHMAVVSVNAADLSEEVRKNIKVLTLGNSYFVKSGDFVIGAGCPAGMVHSTTYGTISSVARNVQMTDSVTRILYADIRSNSKMGTFLLNTAGEIIGWTTDAYVTEDNSDITTAISISDYKVVLDKMTNGIQAPYFGVKGQEVNEAMRETGIPSGVYVTEAVAGGPAYDAGIQNGDIITFFGEKEITTFKELQSQIENLSSGTAVTVTVMRKGRDGYIELEYPVNIRAR